MSPNDEWRVFLGMLLTAPLMPALHLAGLWLVPRGREVVTLRWVWALYGFTCAALLVGFGATTPRSVAIMLALWWTLFLGYAQVVSMVSRSISLRLVVELRINPGASADDLFRDYADGRGFTWLLKKRLDDLAGLGLIHGDERRLQKDSTGGPQPIKVTKQGKALGRFGLVAKRVLNLKETG